MNSESYKKRKLHNSPQLFDDTASDHSKDDSQCSHQRLSRVELISSANPNIKCSSPFSEYPRFSQVLIPEPISESSPSRLCCSPFSAYERFNRVLTPELVGKSTSNGPLSLSNVVFINTCGKCDHMLLPSVDGNEKSNTLMNQLMAQLSCEEVASSVIELDFKKCEMISKSTSTTDLEVVSTYDESFDIWDNIVQKQGERVNDSIRKLHEQTLEQMILVNNLASALDLASDETE